MAEHRRDVSSLTWDDLEESWRERDKETVATLRKMGLTGLADVAPESGSKTAVLSGFSLVLVDQLAREFGDAELAHLAEQEGLPPGAREEFEEARTALSAAAAAWIESQGEAGIRVSEHIQAIVADAKAAEQAGMDWTKP